MIAEFLSDELPTSVLLLSLAAGGEEGDGAREHADERRLARVDVPDDHHVELLAGRRHLGEM